MVEISNPEQDFSGDASGQQNCIFCHIISGRVPSKEVYSDDRVKAVLDINPANPGHVLVLPKEHHMILPQVPDDLIGYMAMVAKGISKACIRALKAQATNIFVANGAAAGQKAAHVMLHIIPRTASDNLQAFALPHRQMPDEQYGKIAAVLGERVRKVLGVQGEGEPAPPARAQVPAALARVSAPPPMTAQTAKTAVDLDTIATLLSGAPTPSEAPAEIPEGTPKGAIAFIASKRGGKFHMPNCPFIAKINPENRVEIADRQTARARELKPCECVHHAE